MQVAIIMEGMGMMMRYYNLIIAGKVSYKSKIKTKRV